MTGSGCWDRWRDAHRTIAAVDVTAFDRLLFVALASFADATGRCWPSVDALAELTVAPNVKNARRQVQRGLARLVDAGVLVVEAVSGGIGTNRYRLVLGVVGESTTRGSGAAGNDPQPAAQGPRPRGSGAAGTRGSGAAGPAAQGPREESLKSHVEQTSNRAVDLELELAAAAAGPVTDFVNRAERRRRQRRLANQATAHRWAATP